MQIGKAAFSNSFFVIPAKAGIHGPPEQLSQHCCSIRQIRPWISAFAEMTIGGAMRLPLFYLFFFFPFMKRISCKYFTRRPTENRASSQSNQQVAVGEKSNRIPRKVTLRSHLKRLFKSAEKTFSKPWRENHNSPFIQNVKEPTQILKSNPTLQAFRRSPSADGAMQWRMAYQEM